MRRQLRTLLVNELEVDPEEADIVMNWFTQGRDAVVEDDY